MSSVLNMPELIKKLRSINYVLENLEVKGRNNLDILLGSMQAIDQVAGSLEMHMNELEQRTDPIEE